MLHFGQVQNPESSSFGQIEDFGQVRNVESSSFDRV